MRRILLCLAILATACVVAESATGPVEDRRGPKAWNPLCSHSPVAKGLRKRKCDDVSSKAHCSALMQVCNATWANMPTSAALEAKVNIMGDIITSMITLLEDMTNQQIRLNLTVDRLATAGSQTNTQINPPTLPVGSPSTPSAACTFWNKTEAHHSLVFFTVKKLDGSSAPCSDAITDAFITQLKADYTDNIDNDCGDADLVIGMDLHSGTPKRGSDFGCISTSSSASPSAGAMYFAVVTANSHFPCAQQAVVNIVDRQFNYVCSGPFARTCNKLKSMTGASASVVDVAEFALRDGSPCTKCISQVGSPGAACYPKGNTWTS